MGLTNGRANGNGAHAVDHTKLRQEAGQISDVVSRIAQITDQVSAGADAQARSLDTALSGLNQITASLKETAGQAETVSGSTDGLLSSINEVAASIEQVTRNSENLATFITQTASSIKESNASIISVTNTSH